MLVLFSGDPVGLFSGQNIGALQDLEAQLRTTNGVATVVGPYTAVRYAADQLAAAPVCSPMPSPALMTPPQRRPTSPLRPSG